MLFLLSLLIPVMSVEFSPTFLLHLRQINVYIVFLFLLMDFAFFSNNISCLEGRGEIVVTWTERAFHCIESGEKKTWRLYIIVALSVWKLYHSLYLSLHYLSFTFCCWLLWLLYRFLLAKCFSSLLVTEVCLSFTSVDPSSHWAIQ